MTLVIDIMANNKIASMVTTSRDIHFGDAELIQDKTLRTIMTSIQQVVYSYHSMGLQVCNILSLGGFECIRDQLSEICITLKSHPEMSMYLRLRDI